MLISAFALVGLAVAARMQVKATAARRGMLAEPSVVQTPRAHLIGNTPNSALGLAYYAFMLLAAWFMNVPAVWLAALCAAALAAAMSAYLAYSLRFITRMPCALCWTSHAVNWLLLVAVIARRWTVG